MQGDRSTTMTGMSVASSLNSTSQTSPRKKRSTTADAIFEKEFKEKSKKGAPLKCKLKEMHINRLVRSRGKLREISKQQALDFLHFLFQQFPTLSE